MRLQGTPIAAPSERRNTRPLRAAMALLSLCCAGAAAYFIFSTLISVWHLGWTEMFQDQFRQYTKLLQSPFPANIFAPDNAHRQVLSNLVRLADIHWGRGEQTIGVVAGLIMMVAAMASMGLVIWRSTSHSIAYRCAASLLAAIALFWMGSARMQFHGNDSFQTYVVITCAVWVVIWVERIKAQPSWPHAVVVWLIAFIAMLTFGTGVAVFGLLICLLLVRRVAWRWSLAISTVALLSVLMYLFLFPSGDGVRGSLSFSVAPLLKNTTTWLSSFWLSSWLSHADQSLLGTSADQVRAQAFGSTLVSTARLIDSGLGHPALLKIGSAIGSIGLILLLPMVWRAWRDPSGVSRVESMALALSVFALGIGVLVALSRAQLFIDHPTQVVAERYVIWTNIYWFGLALGYAARFRVVSWRSAAFAGASLLIAMMVFPLHQISRGWASSVERETESRAAQFQSNIIIEAGVLDHTDMPDVDRLKSVLHVLFSHQVGPFRTPRSRLMGATLTATTPDTTASLVEYFGPPQRVFPLDASSGPGWRVSGILKREVMRGAEDGLLVINRENMVVGLGEFGYEFESTNYLRRMDHAAHGFDVYFRAPISEVGLRLVLVDAAGQSFTVLSDLPARTESP